MRLAGLIGLIIIAAGVGVLTLLASLFEGHGDIDYDE